MSAWSKDELRKIAGADDLHISPFRDDGVTYGTPTWIWSVAVDDALYVRAYNGQRSRWYEAAMRQKAGRITGADMTNEVTFEPVNGPINDRIDAAFQLALFQDGLPTCRCLLIRYGNEITPPASDDSFGMALIHRSRTCS